MAPGSRRPRAARDEVEAAYFTLLRARDELTSLRRYEEFLHDEVRRLRRFESEGQALDDSVPRALRRRLSHTDEDLADAVRTRRAVASDELEHLPERIAAAEAFIVECENEHDQLRRA